MAEVNLQKGSRSVRDCLCRFTSAPQGCQTHLPTWGVSLALMPIYENPSSCSTLKPTSMPALHLAFAVTLTCPDLSCT